MFVSKRGQIFFLWRLLYLYECHMSKIIEMTFRHIAQKFKIAPNKSDITLLQKKKRKE